MVDTSALQTSIINDLTAEIGAEESFNATLLATKVKLAVIDVLARRQYENSSYTDAQIVNELSTRYYTTITNLARFDYNQAGAEGQKTHSENGIGREWLDRSKMLSQINPFVKIL